MGVEEVQQEGSLLRKTLIQVQLLALQTQGVGSGLLVRVVDP